MPELTINNSVHLLDTKNETEAIITVDHIEPYSWEPKDTKPTTLVHITWTTKTQGKGSQRISITLATSTTKDLIKKLTSVIEDNAL